jgi:hypothetical protein
LNDRDRCAQVTDFAVALGFCLKPACRLASRTLSASSFVASAWPVVGLFFGQAAQRVGWDLPTVADQARGPRAYRVVGRGGQGVAEDR